VTLAELVDTSNAVAGVRSRLQKVARLADLLARLSRAEVPVAVAFLSGAARQGRIGVGGALIHAAREVAPAGEAALTLEEVDRARSARWPRRGAGSARARAELLRALFARRSTACSWTPWRGRPASPLQPCAGT